MYHAKGFSMAEFKKITFKSYVFQRNCDSKIHSHVSLKCIPLVKAQKVRYLISINEIAFPSAILKISYG